MGFKLEMAWPACSFARTTRVLLVLATNKQHRICVHVHPTYWRGFCSQERKAELSPEKDREREDRTSNPGAGSVGGRLWVVGER